MGESITITRTPSLANDEPILAEGCGVRVKDIVDRLRAGDSIADVAKDFGVHTDSVQLLWEVAKACEPESDSAGITAVPCPTCGGPCKVVNGDEGTSYFKPVRGQQQ